MGNCATLSPNEWHLGALSWARVCLKTALEPHSGVAGGTQQHHSWIAAVSLQFCHSKQHPQPSHTPGMERTTRRPSSRKYSATNFEYERSDKRGNCLRSRKCLCPGRIINQILRAQSLRQQNLAFCLKRWQGELSSSCHGQFFTMSHNKEKKNVAKWSLRWPKDQ